VAYNEFWSPILNCISAKSHIKRSHIMKAACNLILKSVSRIKMSLIWFNPCSRSYKTFFHHFHQQRKTEKFFVCEENKFYRIGYCWIRWFGFPYFTTAASKNELCLLQKCSKVAYFALLL